MRDEFGEKLVMKAVECNAQIVEIGEQPSLEVGNVKQLIGDISDLVPLLCHNIIA